MQKGDFFAGGCGRNFRRCCDRWVLYKEVIGTLRTFQCVDDLDARALCRQGNDILIMQRS